MKGIVVLIFISIAVTSSVSSDIEVTTKDSDVTVMSSSEESLRTRPVFPKSTQTFFLTTTLTNVGNITTSSNRSSRKPVLKIVSKERKNKNSWKTATARPSMMKYTKFTINPLAFTLHGHPENSDNQTDKYDVLNRKYGSNNIGKLTTSSDEDSSEEALDTPTENEKRKNELKRVKKIIRRFHKLRSKINKAKYKETISKLKNIDKFNRFKDFADKTKPNDTLFSSEEKEDRKEFIFVAPKKTKEQDVKVAEDSEESTEVTTNVLEKVLKPRQKRSINIIEEENLGTTVSSFKFTGKVTALSNDLVFRNINT